MHTKKKARSRRYSAETIMIADYTDHLVLLANTLIQTESLQYSLEQAARGIGLYVNSDKAEFVYFKQDGAISTLKGKPLKIVNHFTYLGSNILSMESNISMLIGKTWTAIDRLSIIWKSDLYKMGILSSCDHISTTSTKVLKKS